MPRLRGYSHAAAFPIVLAAGVVLIVLARSAAARVGASIYMATSAMLFGISALYHRGNWGEETRSILKRLDHANIYLIIAGTYTPFAILSLTGAAQLAVLTVVWTGALAGVVFRFGWITAPRWLYTSLYVLLGWIAVFVIPQLLHGAGAAAFTLIVIGGALYTAGGIVYALRKPDPFPRSFGFHEVFHALTIAAYTSQYIAVSLVTYRLA